MKTVNQVQLIPIVEINSSVRLRQVNEDQAQFIAENITQVGRLRNPIEVRKVDDVYMLIAGGHRLRAAEILGWSEIPAFVLDLDNDQARLAEIDENLVRHELIPLDRANFMAERKALYEKLYPETKHGKTSGNQYTGQKREGDTMSFSQATAEKVGLTERSIQRAVKIATQISPIVKNLLARQATPWTQKDLLILCDVPQELQYTVVEKVTDGMKLNKAIADVSGTATPDDSQEDKQFKKLMQAWGDASPPVQEQFLATLREAKVIES